MVTDILIVIACFVGVIVLPYTCFGHGYLRGRR